jgi:hypothetical protein
VPISNILKNIDFFNLLDKKMADSEANQAFLWKKMPSDQD